VPHYQSISDKQIFNYCLTREIMDNSFLSSDTAYLFLFDRLLHGIVAPQTSPSGSERTVRIAEIQTSGNE
jgi:hypothetical protein